MYYIISVMMIINVLFLHINRRLVPNKLFQANMGNQRQICGNYLCIFSKKKDSYHIPYYLYRIGLCLNIILSASFLLIKGDNYEHNLISYPSFLMVEFIIIINKCKKSYTISHNFHAITSL